jgi:hypothetical protein
MYANPEVRMCYWSSSSYNRSLEETSASLTIVSLYDLLATEIAGAMPGNAVERVTALSPSTQESASFEHLQIEMLHSMVTSESFNLSGWGSKLADSYQTITSC